MAKRIRSFILERRSVPSVVGIVFGREPGTWSHVRTFDRLEAARQFARPVASSLFARGTEYKVRRTDTPAA